MFWCVWVASVRLAGRRVTLSASKLAQPTSNSDSDTSTEGTSLGVGQDVKKGEQQFRCVQCAHPVAELYR